MGRFSWLEITPATAEHTDSALPSTLASDGSSFAAEALHEANRLLTDGLYAQALRQYSRAIDEDKDSLQAWLGQTLCQLALDEKDQAAVWAKNLRERFPAESAALFAWQLTQSALGREQEQIAAWLQQQGEPDPGELAPFCAYARAVCLFDLGDPEAGQEALVALLQGLSERDEQVRWILLTADFLLRRRLADGACALLEALEEAQALNAFGLSLWVKAEWLRGEGSKARDLMATLRHRDPAAITIYGVNEYLEQVSPATRPGVRQYLTRWLNRFNRS